MNEYLSTIIIALITGVFSIITVIIQKKQDKVISKIDEQSSFIDREKELKKKLIKKEKEREALIQEIMMLILDTNITILKNTNGDNGASAMKKFIEASDALKTKFDQLSESIEEINKEYSLVLDLTNQMQQEIDRAKPKKR